MNREVSWDLYCKRNQDNADLGKIAWVKLTSIYIIYSNMYYVLSTIKISTWKRRHNELSSTMSTSSCLFFQSVSGQIALDDRDPMIRSATPWIVLVVRYITRILNILHVIYLYLTCLVYVMNLEISDMHLIWTCKLLCHSWLDG